MEVEMEDIHRWTRYVYEDIARVEESNEKLRKLGIELSSSHTDERVREMEEINRLANLLAPIIRTAMEMNDIYILKKAARLEVKGSPEDWSYTLFVLILLSYNKIRCAIKIKMRNTITDFVDDVIMPVPEGMEMFSNEAAEMAALSYGVSDIKGVITRAKRPSELLYNIKKSTNVILFNNNGELGMVKKYAGEAISLLVTEYVARLCYAQRPLSEAVQLTCDIIEVIKKIMSYLL